MSYAKIGLYLAVILAVAAAIWGVHRWDKNRLDAAYDRGVTAERAEWVAGQAKADAEQAAREKAAQSASEAASDAARASAGKATTETTAATEAGIGVIQREYTATPSKAVSCITNGNPAPVPERVSKELDDARAALIAARAAPG